MPLERKLVGVFFVALVILLSYKILPLIGWGYSGTYYRIVGYNVKLEYTLIFIFWEIIFSILLFVFYIIQESFVSLKKQMKIFFYLIPLLTLNLIFMNVIIAMYPIIRRSYGFLSATGEEIMKHPLIFISYIFFLILLLWNCRLLKKSDTNKKYLKVILYINIIIQLITSIILMIRIPILESIANYRP